MKNTELRIGNYVEIYGRVEKVVDVMCDSVNTFYIEGAHYGLVNPIPLTEELLEKLGFEKYEFFKTRFRYKKGVFEFRHGVDLLMIGRHEKAMRCASCIGLFSDNYEYVHQLQNLYFALTGEELTI
jgi:hypothetical protein